LQKSSHAEVEDILPN